MDFRRFVAFAMYQKGPIFGRHGRHIRVGDREASIGLAVKIVEALGYRLYVVPEDERPTRGIRITANLTGNRRRKKLVSNAMQEKPAQSSSPPKIKVPKKRSPKSRLAELNKELTGLLRETDQY